MATKKQTAVRAAAYTLPTGASATAAYIAARLGVPLEVVFFGGALLAQGGHALVNALRRRSSK